MDYDPSPPGITAKWYKLIPSPMPQYVRAILWDGSPESTRAVNEFTKSRDWRPQPDEPGSDNFLVTSRHGSHGVLWNQLLECDELVSHGMHIVQRVDGVGFYVWENENWDAADTFEGYYN